MSGPAHPPAGDPSSPRRVLRPWLLGLAGAGLFLAGAALGVILALSVTLYRAPVGLPEPTPVPLSASAPPTVLPSEVVPTVPPTATRLPVGPSVGLEAPPFTLPDLEGTEYTLTDYRGQIVLVHFWASWCPPCREEWPGLRVFAERVASREIVVLAVNVEESAEVVHDFVGDELLPFPVLLDAEGSVNERYRVAALPTTFLLDAEGIVRQVVPGNMDAAELERLVDMLNVER